MAAHQHATSGENRSLDSTKRPVGQPTQPTKPSFVGFVGTLFLVGISNQRQNGRPGALRATARLANRPLRICRTRPESARSGRPDVSMKLERDHLSVIKVLGSPLKGFWCCLN